MILLEQYFGYQHFKYPQSEIIDAVLAGEEAIALLPTGFGKSVTFQIPALMLEGLTIVISPLIALMNDQVQHLNEKHIPAQYIHSEVSLEQQEHIYSSLQKGKTKLLYVSPERLRNPYFLQKIGKLKISFIAVDEAHTILWGEGFREAFAHISDFIEQLEVRPRLLALTATATNQTIDKIKNYLKLRNPKIFSLGMDRPTIHYRVLHTTDKINFLSSYLKQHLNQKGLIYCATRVMVEKLSATLKQLGIPNTYYHGGLDTDLKLIQSELFSIGTKPLMICTNAYGMGIDISDIRFVIHYQLPATLEDLAQQMGRAARDGKEAEGILLFSFQDVKVIQYLIQSSPLERQQYQEKQRQLDQVVDYCFTKSCRHQYLAQYFGQNIQTCGDFCDNCRKNRQR